MQKIKLRSARSFRRTDRLTNRWTDMVASTRLVILGRMNIQCLPCGNWHASFCHLHIVSIPFLQGIKHERQENAITNICVGCNGKRTYAHTNTLTHTLSVVQLNKKCQNNRKVFWRRSQQPKKWQRKTMRGGEREREEEHKCLEVQRKEKPN